MNARNLLCLIWLALGVMGCAQTDTGGQLEFDIENFVTMDPADFRVIGTVPEGLGFTGRGVFHLRVLLPNDDIITDQTYALREVSRLSDPNDGDSQIAFALRPRDEAIFHLQQSALLSSLVAGFVNFESDKTSVGFCRTSPPLPVSGQASIIWRDSGRNLTIARIILRASSLVSGDRNDSEICAS